MIRKAILYIIMCNFCSTLCHAQSDDFVMCDSVVCDTLAVDSSYVTPTLTLQEQMEKLLSTDMFHTSTVGIEIYDLTGDSIVFKHNERQTLRPASTMKLLTAITAFDRLGGSYRFKTSLKYKGKLVQRLDSLGKEANRILVGDIIVKGGMDPRFGNDDMKAFIDEIKKERIDTIYGKLVADLSFKDKDRLGEGWCWDDNNPCLTPLLWEKKDTFLEAFNKELSRAGITILPNDAMPKDSLFESQLKAVEKTTEKTLGSRFHSIDQIATRMMKNSDNLFAESMFYQVAASSNVKYASARQARDIMNQLIRKLKLDPKRYYIADGSGLSLYNYQSAELQVELLKYAHSNPNIYTHLLPSLPIAGIDGTLKDRMSRLSCRGNVKAKTGTVDGVSSLAGYVFCESGNLLCFSIINQGIRHTSSGKNFQDKVCQIMYNYKKQQ